MSPRSSYETARQYAGIIDLSSQGKIRLRGRDRASYLHALLTNDIQALTAGTGCYAAYLTPQGRMITDMIVLELGDMILLVVEPFVSSTLARRLDQLLFSEDVQAEDVTTRWGAAAVIGPAAADVVGGIVVRELDIDASNQLRGLTQFQNVRHELFGEPVIFVRDDWWGLPGFHVYASTEVLMQLTETWQSSGAVLLDSDAAEIIRVEAGRPRFGIDMDQDTLPLEAGIEDRAISFTKGCYVGQEVIVRVLHRGHGRVARRLVGLTFDGPEVPTSNDAIVHEQKSIGRVTSAVLSPALGRAIALGYVHREVAAPGTAVVVGESRLAAVVSSLPFSEFSSTC